LPYIKKSYRPSPKILGKQAAAAVLPPRTLGIGLYAAAELKVKATYFIVTFSFFWKNILSSSSALHLP